METALWQHPEIKRNVHLGQEIYRNRTSSFEDMLWLYDGITLAEMDEVALMNRQDTKFVMREEALEVALFMLRNQYRILRIDGNAVNHYLTVNYDTPDFALFNAHQAGALNRYKVRSRTYLDSGDSFVEVKFKTNKGRTVKNRVPLNGDDAEAIDVNTFLEENSPYDQRSLEPKLWTRFSRMTFVHRTQPERVTVDVDLEFNAMGNESGLPGLAIVEVKQERASVASDFIRQLRVQNIRTENFSKYCMGVSLIYPDVKDNNFKSRKLMVEKLMRKNKHGIAH